MINPMLTIEIMIECPHCEHYFNLIDCDGLSDDAWIYEILFSDDGWGCKDFSKIHLDSFDEEFKCPKCDRVILIGDIEY